MSIFGGSVHTGGEFRFAATYLLYAQSHLQRDPQYVFVHIRRHMSQGAGIPFGFIQAVGGIEELISFNATEIGRRHYRGTFHLDGYAAVFPALFHVPTGFAVKCVGRPGFALNMGKFEV